MWKKHMHRKNIERKFLKIAVGLSVWGTADSIIHSWNSIIMVTILCIDFWSPELIIIFPMCFNTIGWSLTVIYALFRQTKIHTFIVHLSSTYSVPSPGYTKMRYRFFFKKLTEKKKHKSISNIQYYFSEGWREGEQKKKYGEHSDKRVYCSRGTDDSNQFFFFDLGWITWVLTCE